MNPLKFLDATAFYMGLLFGAGGICALWLIMNFVTKHWKAVLIVSALLSALSLAAIAIL